MLRAQHDTALGQSISSCGSTTTTTTVEAGTALELAAGIPENNGGIRAGIQTWNEHLILNGAGNTFFDDAPLVNMIGTDLAGNDLVGDNMWRGPVTLNTSATTYTVTFQNALGNAAQNTMSADGTGLAGTDPTVSVATTLLVEPQALVTMAW